MKTLLLWDIDGTLITSHGAGWAALCDSLLASFGLKSDLAQVELAGRTDRWIFRQILLTFDLPVTTGNIALLENNYLSALPMRISETGVSPFPGVKQIVESASGKIDISQGLLTGNLRVGAEIKLRPTGLWPLFPFGAFGDDSEERNHLGPFALQRAFEHHQTLVPRERTWVIGDTPYDVACGKAAGVRTLAVATGRHSLECLHEAGPDAALADLSDERAFWDLVLSSD